MFERWSAAIYNKFVKAIRTREAGKRKHEIDGRDEVCGNEDIGLMAKARSIPG